jgi:predicted dehydrogenase
LRELNQIYQEKKSRLKTGVCYQRRYANNYEKMYQRVNKESSLGQIETMHLVSRDKFKPDTEFMKNNDNSKEGIFIDFSCHDFDLIRYHCCSYHSIDIYLVLNSRKSMLKQIIYFSMNVLLQVTLL